MTPVLYIFVRTDLPSMTPGKAMAHSGHAANAFVFKNYIVPTRVQREVDKSIFAWMAQTPYGFGTQINLKAPWHEVINAVANVCEAKVGTGELVVDPTYPYIVDAEIVNLIDTNIHTATPVRLENGNYLCCRSETTAAYIFGYKEELEMFVGRYPLHP